MAIRLVIPAIDPPVTLAEVKLAVRFDDAALDAEITSMLMAATRVHEHECGQSLMPQTWELTLDAFPSGDVQAITLTRIPVASITTIIYADAAGTVITLAGGAFVLDAADQYGSAYAVPAYGGVWPVSRGEINAVRLRYVAGFADAASVPWHHKQAVKIIVAQMLDDPACLQDRLAAVDKAYAL